MVQLTLRRMDQPSLVYDVPPTFTFADLKLKVQTEQGVPRENIKFVFAGRRLEDSMTVDEAGVERETAILMVVMGGARPAAAPVVTVTAGAAPSSPAVSTPPVDVPPPPPTAAPTTTAASAGAGGGGSMLSFRLLNGSVVTLEVDLAEKLGAIKERLSPQCKIIPSRINLIYRGQILNDDTTPADHDLGNQTCVHVVCKKLDAPFLDTVFEEYEVRESVAAALPAGLHVFTPADMDIKPRNKAPEGTRNVMPLNAHCQVCHSIGGPFSCRAACPKCGSESVMITAGSIDSGRSTFRSLLGIEVECLDPVTQCGYAGPARIGFLCKAPNSDGTVCPARAPPAFSADRRSMDSRFKYSCVVAGPENTKPMLDTLNQLFGYPAFGGEDVPLTRGGK